MKDIVLWKGFHEEGGSLRGQVRSALQGDLLLILCPPGLENFDFLQFLPPGRIRCSGNGWVDAGKAFVEATDRLRKNFAAYPSPPAFGVFTSGSTGEPRLILYSLENVGSSINAVYALFDRSRIDAIFCYPQPFHVFGLALGYIAAEKLGVELLSPEGKYARHFHEKWMESRSSGVVTLATPTHMKDLWQFAKEEGSARVNSYAAILGGASVERNLWLALRDELGIEAPSVGYGASEASPGITHLPPGREPLVDNEVGFPLSHLLIEVDHERGVRFSGPSLCLAIVERGEVQFPKSYLLLDSLERRDDGSLIYQGRLNLMLNRGGVKYSLEAIERAIESEFGLHSICTPLPDSRLGEELGVLIAGGEVSRDSLRDFLRKKFDSSFDGLRVASSPQMPLNSNSKPDRFAAKKILIESLSRSS